MYGFSQGSLCLLLYFIICVAVVFSIRLLFRIPTEVFRKLLHWVLLGSVVVSCYLLQCGARTVKENRKR